MALISTLIKCEYVFIYTCVCVRACVCVPALAALARACLWNFHTLPVRFSFVLLICAVS